MAESCQRLRWRVKSPQCGGETTCPPKRGACYRCPRCRGVCLALRRATLRRPTIRAARCAPSRRRCRKWSLAEVIFLLRDGRDNQRTSDHFARYCAKPIELAIATRAQGPDARNLAGPVLRTAHLAVPRCNPATLVSSAGAGYSGALPRNRRGNAKLQWNQFFTTLARRCGVVTLQCGIRGIVKRLLLSALRGQSAKWVGRG